MRNCTLVVLCLLGSADSGAHPAIDEQIRDLTARIEAEPANATLYLRRGELHRLHHDWARAEADYEAARKLDPELLEVLLCRGRLELDAGKPAKARGTMDRYLALRPNDPEARVLRARALARIGKHLDAAADFTAAIESPGSGRPGPELYLERARAFDAAGPEHLERAVRGLDEGLERLGRPVTLELAAMELEIKGQRYEAALARVDRLAAQSVRKERWLARKGEILELAGRRAEARAAYLGSLKAIETLPASRRGTKAVRDLETEVRNALEDWSDDE